MITVSRSRWRCVIPLRSLLTRTKRCHTLAHDVHASRREVAPIGMQITTGFPPFAGTLGQPWPGSGDNHIWKESLHVGRIGMLVLHSEIPMRKRAVRRPPQLPSSKWVSYQYYGIVDTVYKTTSSRAATAVRRM